MNTKNNVPIECIEVNSHKMKIICANCFSSSSNTLVTKISFGRFPKKS